MAYELMVDEYDFKFVIFCLMKSKRSTLKYEDSVPIS